MCRWIIANTTSWSDSGVARAEVEVQAIVNVARRFRRRLRMSCSESREHQILQLVDQSMSNKQIARHLGIEVATAKNHVHNILQKLHVHRRIDASSWYRQGGFHLKLEA